MKLFKKILLMIMSFCMLAFFAYLPVILGKVSEESVLGKSGVEDISENISQIKHQEKLSESEKIKIMCNLGSKDEIEVVGNNRMLSQTDGELSERISLEMANLQGEGIIPKSDITEKNLEWLCIYNYIDVDIMKPLFSVVDVIFSSGLYTVRIRIDMDTFKIYEYWAESVYDYYDDYRINRSTVSEVNNVDIIKRYIDYLGISEDEFCQFYNIDNCPISICFDYDI